MHLSCDESLAWVLVVTAVAIAGALVLTFAIVSGNTVKIECLRTQQAAMAASAPMVECKR